MSWVANMMLVAQEMDLEVVETLSDWLKSDCPWRAESVAPGATGVGFLRDITASGAPHGWGGFKSPECDIWAGALNHADLDAVVAKVASLPWGYPAAVQLLLMDQEETYFRLWMWRDGEFKQYAPPPPPNADEAWAW